MASSVIITNASVEECSAQAGLPGSLQPCAETLACEDAKQRQSTNTNSNATYYFSLSDVALAYTAASHNYNAPGKCMCAVCTVPTKPYFYVSTTT